MVFDERGDCMFRRLVIVLVMVAVWAAGVRAQELQLAVPEGPAPKADTLERRPQLLPEAGALAGQTAPPAALPEAERPAFFRFHRTPALPVPSLLAPSTSLLPPDQFGYETREELAARVDAATKARVMESIDKDLYWHRLPKLSRPAKVAYTLAGLFLSNPFGFREGYVPLMNPSFPFIYAYTPGMAPYERQYTNDLFPQAIGVEFDLASGTYKQKMVDWTELQKNMARSFGGAYNYEPVPQIPVTPVERAMQQH